MITAHHLDASAAIKLFIPEGNSEFIRKYFASCQSINNTWQPFFMTSLSIGETIGVLKVKHYYRNEISEDEYFFSCRLLFSYIEEKMIQIDEVDLTIPLLFYSVEDIAKKYNIDLADAFQIITVGKGKHSILAAESKTIFITADESLANAARKEGLRVWNCVKEQTPPME